MVDDIPEPNLPDPNKIDAVGNSINKVSESAKNAGESLKNMGSLAFGVQSAFDNMASGLDSTKLALTALTNAMSGVGISMTVNKGLTENQTTQFSLLSNAIIGARKAYDNLGSGIDASGINTFSKQIEYFTNTLGESKAGIGGLVSFAQSVFGQEVPKSVQTSVNAVKIYINNLAQSADNALKLQNAFLQLSGKTGNLNNVFAIAGPKLENINALLQTQTKMMNDAAVATGAAPEVIERYYSELGTIPGALQSMITNSSDAQNNTHMLTAAMKIAAGTGRNFEEVVADLRTAFIDYGITGEYALKFSTEISAVTQNLEVEFNTVRDALKSNAESFRMFVGEGDKASKMASGLADIMNHYASALKTTGLSGTASVDVMRNMTSQITQMDIAKKSFLSAQTGGPGGLMGAFQIDKMIRDGDIKAVFEKVRVQMQKQFGQIVTLDEAASSQSAAAQMTKQMQILKSGPLGQFARSDAEAQRILEGFKAVQEGRGGGELEKDLLSSTIDKGTAIQEKSYTVMNESRAHLEAIRKSADIGTLGFIQKSGLTAGVGSPLGHSDMLQNAAAERNRKQLKQTMFSAANIGSADLGNEYFSAMKNKAVTDTTGKSAVKSISDLQNSIKHIGDSFTGPAEQLKKVIGVGDVNQSNNQLKLLEDDIKKRKQALKNATGEERKKQLDIINKEEAQLKEASLFINKNPEVNLASATGKNKAMPAGVKVGMAANMAVGTPVMGSDSNDVRAPVKANLAPTKTDVNVHITGFCLKCKQEIDSNSQANGIAPQAK